MGVRFKKQHPIWKYIADFYCHQLKLVIEVDGSIHNLKDVKENDKAREEGIVSSGITVIRFRNEEIRKNIETVIDRIKTVIVELKKIDNERKIS